MHGTATFQPNVFDRLGNALRAFKAAPTPGQLFAPQPQIATSFLTFPGWDWIEKNSPSARADERNAKVAIANPWVYRDISAIAKELSAATIQIKQRGGDDGDTDIDNHPVEVLWENPNEFMGRSWLMQFWAWQLLLFGEAYLYYIPSGVAGRDELWPIPSLFMTPIPDDKRFIAGYRFRRDSASQGILIDSRPIIYSRLTNPFDIRRGLSPLAALMVDVEGDQAMARWNKAFFSKENALPTGMISLDKDTLDTDVTRVRQEIMEFYGSGNRRIAVARAGDMAWTAFERAQKDMEFLQGRRFNAELIDTVFGIPSGLWSERANRANAEGAKATFIENAVWPHLVLLAEDLNAQFLPLWYGDDLRAEFDDIRPRNRALELQELNTYQGFLTIDELRARIDEGDIGDARGQMLVAEVAKGAPTPGSEPAQELEDQQAAKEAEQAALMPPEVAPPVEGEVMPPEEAALPVEADGGEVIPMEAGKAIADLRLWERKALKRLKERGHADAPFESTAIAQDDWEYIHAALKTAQTPDAVRAVFAIKEQDASERAMFAKLGASGKLREKNSKGDRTGPREGASHAGGGSGGTSTTTTTHQEQRTDAEAEHSPALTAALNHAERSISINPFETAHVFDRSGNSILTKEGGQHAVSFNDAESAQLKGAILTHNHPHNVSFSRADVQTTIEHELGEMRAVTGNHRYSLRVPPGTKWTPQLESHIQSRYNGMLIQARADVAAHKRTVNDVNRNLHHELWTAIAGEQGWAYERKDW